MEIKIPSRSTIIPALILLGTVMAGLSALFFSRLDQIVQGDLDIYGLQSDYNWTIQYLAYSRLLAAGLIMATAVTGISFIVMRPRAFQARIRITRAARFISCLLLLTGIVSAGVSVFFFDQIDYLFYQRADELWIPQCWTYARLFLGSIAIATTTSSISISLLLNGRAMQERYFVSTHIHLKLNSTHIIPLALLSGGAIALALSIIYTSSVLAFVGLGLVFWGGLLYYIRPERYVKETLMNRMSLPSLVSLDQIMTGLGYKSKGIHLPPKYFSSFESTKVYFGAQDNTRLPTPEEIRKDENEIFLKNPDGLLITSPGFQLTKLFEQTLGTNFTKVNLQYLERNIPKLLIDLEIAQNVEMTSTDNSVSIRIEGSATRSICTEIRKLSNICGSLGCPLCSSIASAIAKATGKPIVIEKDLASEDGQIIEIRYRLLE